MSPTRDERGIEVRGEVLVENYKTMSVIGHTIQKKYAPFRSDMV